MQAGFTNMADKSANTSAFRRGAVGAPVAHDSAHLHVSGEAPYTDDIPEPRDLLHVAVGMSDNTPGATDGSSESSPPRVERTEDET